MKLTIIGASGHGKVVADIASLRGYNEIEFLDDNDAIKYCGKYPTVGTTDMALSVDGDVFVAIGNAEIRQQLMEKLKNKNIPVLIHPNSVIAEDVKIGKGSVIMAGAVINPGVCIGKGCIINTCCSVDHDCIIGDYVHISVGTHLCGTVTVKDSTWIGAGAIVSNNLNICGNCTIGAGATVIKNIDVPGAYVGVPAKRLEGVE